MRSGACQVLHQSLGTGSRKHIEPEQTPEPGVRDAALHVPVLLMESGRPADSG